MLSKIDIEKQIGKGINIVPFTKENIKENSINITLSNMAWRLMPKSSNTSSNTDDIDYDAAKKACNGDIVTLDPHSTTIIYSKEVIALNNMYGGTFHSKVGIVSKGVVFASTMIGPMYCGHLMVTLHNPTDNKIKLKVGETFISLVLHKLDTKADGSLVNSNTGGHMDKLNYLNVHLDEQTRICLDEDWKKNLELIKDKLQEEKDYKRLQDELKKKRKKWYGLIAIVSLVILAILYVLLNNSITGDSVEDIVSNSALIVIVGLIVAVFNQIIEFVKSRL